ncbi:YkvA family protein [uncultured Brachyspira sp.]|uniref:YkvA family protein n=1 Tax=uncultured Brachyspira sp. TaxID=221953 RepID=UPI00260EBA2B|nr:YkvA family protein [uncultured Brachyspira sp.]
MSNNENNNNNNNEKVFEPEIVNNNEPDKNKSLNSILSWIPFILALIYTVSPVDFIPDVIPVAGWGEDAMFLIVSALHGIQNTVLDKDTSIYKIVKYIKWAAFIFSIILILILILLIVLIFKVSSN